MEYIFASRKYTHTLDGSQAYKQAVQAGGRMDTICSEDQVMVLPVNYVGHMIDANGLHLGRRFTQFDKILYTPDNVTELRLYLGLLTCTYSY